MTEADSWTTIEQILRWHQAAAHGGLRMAKLKLTPEQFARIARAIDEPNRLEMLRQIYACKAVNCGDVTHSLSITAGTASHHFRELENAELVKITKVGRYKNLSPRRDVWEAFLAELQQI